MKIGYVMNAYPMTSTTFIGREIQALEAAGHEVKRFAIRPWGQPLVDPGDLAEEAATTYLLTGPKITILRAWLWAMATRPLGLARAMGDMVALWRVGGGIIRQMAYLVEAVVLAHALRRSGVLHLHAHFSTNAATVAMLAGQLGAPGFSFTLHGPDEFFMPFQNGLRRKIARARFVACISHFCRSQAMLFSDPVLWPKLHIVHCGVVPSDYGSQRVEGPGANLLFVGRLEPAKGAPILIEAFAAVLPRHPQARLTIVGDGSARAALEAQALALGIAPSVRFLGYQPQKSVAQLLGDADVFVLPSFAEGLPVVLMEALASRVPVIATQIAGVPELVQDGISGFIVPPGDLAGLTERMDRLLADPDLRARMGAAGRAKVEAEFDIATEAGKLAGLFDARQKQSQATGRP